MSALNPAADELRSSRVRLDVAPLLALAAPLALLAVALAVAAPALTVQDTWLALVSGREVAQHWLPHVDHLTVLAAGHHWTDQQWLGQLVLYGAARLGGIGLAFTMCALAIVAAFGLAAHIAYRRGASPASILLLLGLAVAAGPWGLQFRAQALALPLFTAILWCVPPPFASRMSSFVQMRAKSRWSQKFFRKLVQIPPKEGDSKVIRVCA